MINMWLQTKILMYWWVNGVVKLCYSEWFSCGSLSVFSYVFALLSTYIFLQDYCDTGYHLKW